MNNILIIGNGFDIYHGLPTRYTDFLFFLKHWDQFVSLINKNIPATGSTSTGIDDEWPISLGSNSDLINDSIPLLAKHYKGYDESFFKQLDEIIKSNRWLKYFIDKNDKDGKWIDFENEIQRIILSLDTIFSGIGKYPITKNANFLKDQFAIDIMNLFFNESEKKEFSPLGPIDEKDVMSFVSTGAKNRIINECIRELNDLIAVLRFYLLDLVDNIKVEKYSEQINRLGNLNVLSFNYTDTFRRVYGPARVLSCHHVHGSLIEDNMVLGIGDDIFDEGILDYIYFQKYFQRIQKRTGSSYKDWIPYYENGINSEDYEVYIMGHSLDPVDSSILDFFISNGSVHKINILYYNDKSYEELVINLIKIIGQDEKINQIGRGRILFEKLSSATLGKVR